MIVSRNSSSLQEDIQEILRYSKAASDGHSLKPRQDSGHYVVTRTKSRIIRTMYFVIINTNCRIL